MKCSHWKVLTAHIFAAAVCSILPIGAGWSQTESYFPPVNAYVDTSDVPTDALTSGEKDDPATPQDESDIFSRIGVKDFLYSQIQNATGDDIGATITGQLVFTDGLKFGIPGLDVFELVIGRGEFAFEVQFREEEDPLAPADPASLKITSVPIALRLKTDLLKPVKKAADGKITEYGKNDQGQYIDGSGKPIFPELIQTVNLIVKYTWDGETEIKLEDPLGGSIPSFAMNTPFMIDDSGIVVDVKGAQIDLSDSASPTGITDPAWRGVKFETFGVHFVNGLDVPEMQAGATAQPPPPEMAGITLTNFFIGNGGFSGRIHGSATGLLSVPLGDMEFELTDIDLEFKQNALTSSGISGIVRDFPFFEKDVKLALALDLSGNFKIGVAADDPNRNGAGLLVWTIDGVVDLEISAIAFEKQPDVFYTTISGAITPLFFDSDVKPAQDSDPRIPVNELRISSKGEVSLKGGWVTLPSKRYIDFNAFRVELSQIGFGAPGDAGTTPGKKWLGFSGGVELVEGLSASAKFKKLQFSWPKDSGTSGVDIILQGVEVAFEQPNVVGFKGSADWFEDPTKKGFAGSVSANLYFLKTSVQGRLVIGETIPSTGPPPAPVGTCETPSISSAFKFFYLDLEAMLPAGIPVFSNTSIYGFSGLFAYNMAPHICAYVSPLRWFESYLASTNVVAGTPPPWIPQSDALAVGLGVILGTTHDDGYSINTKVAVTVAVPGPVVMLTGAGNILKERTGLKDSVDPLFRAIALIDGNQGVFLINLGIYYKVPGGGEVIDLSANAEAFFNLNDPSDWHLWLGRKTPESERIRAKVLKFLSATAYLMLDPDQLSFGAKAGYDSRPKWKFGPLRVKLAAWIGYDIEVSWRPVHAWGQAELGGLAELKAFGFGVGLTASAELEVETPTPYVIDGRFKVKLNLPWPLPDPKAKIHMRWEDPENVRPIDQLVTKASLEASKTAESVQAELRRGVTVTAGDTFNEPLCSAWESLPTMPEISEDTNGNGILDPGEDMDGSGTLGVYVPEPACTERPMAPVTYRPVVSFGRNTNQRLTGPDQPNLIGNTGLYRDEVREGTFFDYNLQSLKIWAAPKTNSTTVIFDEVLPDVYGAWPALLGDPEQPGALYVKLWSKNPFSIYESSTYLFHDGGTGGYSDWFAETYGTYPCPSPAVMELYQKYSTRSHTIHFPGKRCLDPSILVQDDLILPPYHVFAIVIDSEAEATGDAAGDTYQDTAYFHTEGVPLSLEPFVYNTVPANLGNRLYRDYSVGLRFDETYVDLLYKEPGSVEELRYKDPLQKLVIEIVDELGQPIRDEEGNLITITTTWMQASEHVGRRTDSDWLELLASQGLSLAGSMPVDDMVYAAPDWHGGLKPDTRYTARVWFSDRRLLTDSRMTDSIWQTANNVLFAEDDRVLLHEFAFIASKYRTFTELIESYEKKWWPLEVGPVAASVLDPIAGEAALATNPPAGSVSHTHVEYIARYLVQAYRSLKPDEVLTPQLTELITHVPGYDDSSTLTDAEASGILAAWNDELARFEELESIFGLEVSRQPNPNQAELSILQAAGTRLGFVVELPEPIEWARTTVSLNRRMTEADPLVARSIAIVPNPNGTRAFVFDVTGGSTLVLDDAEYVLNFEMHKDVRSLNPVLVNPSSAPSEQAEIVASLPDGFFTPEPQ